VYALHRGAELQATPPGYITKFLWKTVTRKIGYEETRKDNMKVKVN
jgi:hypothetical protein